MNWQRVSGLVFAGSLVTLAVCHATASLMHHLEWYGLFFVVYVVTMTAVPLAALSLLVLAYTTARAAIRSRSRSG
jgi:hypothetical protein